MINTETMAIIAAVAGTGLNMVGIVLMWHFGLSPALKRYMPGAYLTSGEGFKRMSEERDRYSRWLSIGVGISLLGAALQLFGTLIS